MENLSGIKNLDYYHMWEIADHILVNIPNNLPLTQWQIDNLYLIEKANDYTFYIDFVTIEMAKLIAGIHF